jgi:hypothetical protein
MSEIKDNGLRSLLLLLIATVVAAHPLGSATAAESPQAPSGQPPVPHSLEAERPAKPQGEIPLPVEKRLDILEEWKIKVERLPILTDKINFGLNALQFQYSHQDAHVAEGKSQDNIGIRRAELVFWGKLSENFPRWHMLLELESMSLLKETPDCSGSPAGDCSKKPAGTAVASTIFREAYIDFRPVVAWAPYWDLIRMGAFRLPWGIFSETSGGLRDIISTPYLLSVGSGRGNGTGAAGAIDFLNERDLYVDVRGKVANRLEYVLGIANNNGLFGNITGVGANAPKTVYGRLRLFWTDVSWISFTIAGGETNNANTTLNGRGKGKFDRYGLDFRYSSKAVPGLMIQGEWWQGHDGANQTTVGQPAQGACLDITICGGSGAPGQLRRTWYVLAKYLISDGWFRNWEPTIFYEEFDPSSTTSNDLYTRLIVGATYYFEQVLPKIQAKLQINYEFREHQGNGTGNVVGDPFDHNALFVLLQLRYM